MLREARKRSAEFEGHDAYEVFGSVLTREKDELQPASPKHGGGEREAGLGWAESCLQVSFGCGPLPVAVVNEGLVSGSPPIKHVIITPGGHDCIYCILGGGKNTQGIMRFPLYDFLLPVAIFCMQ